MKKYLLTILALPFLFLTQLSAAPMHAYYCFNASSLESGNNFVGAFDAFYNSSASKGISTHRLYAFELNGEYEFTHCMVGEHESPDAYEKTNSIVQSSNEGIQMLETMNSTVTWIMDGAGTPVAAFGNGETNPIGAIIDIHAKDANTFITEVTKMMKNSSIDGSMIVFADTFTGITGRTHYVAISSSSLEGVLSNLNGSLSSPEGKQYLKRAKKFRKVMNTSLFSLVKSWEAK